MAGAGQPWYMPGLWPVGHVTSALSRPNDEKVKEPSTEPIVDFKDAAATTTSGFRVGLHGPAPNTDIKISLWARNLLIYFRRNRP